MKSGFYFLVILVLFSGALLSQQVMAQENNNPNSLDVLRKKIDELEIKTKLQQEKINELEGMMEQLNKKKPFAVFPREPRLNKKPNNASPFEFNGNTYYFVPLIGKYINDIETLESTKRDSK